MREEVNHAGRKEKVSQEVDREEVRQEVFGEEVRQEVFGTEVFGEEEVDEEVLRKEEEIAFRSSRFPEGGPSSPPSLLSP